MMKKFLKIGIFLVVLFVVYSLVFSSGSTIDKDEKIVDALQMRGFNNDAGDKIGSVSTGVEFIRLIILPDEFKKDSKYLDDVLSVRIGYANGLSAPINWSTAKTFKYEGRSVYGLCLIWRASIMDYSTSKPQKVIFTFDHPSGANVIERDMS